MGVVKYIFTKTSFSIKTFRDNSLLLGSLELPLTSILPRPVHVNINHKIVFVQRSEFIKETKKFLRLAFFLSRYRCRDLCFLLFSFSLIFLFFLLESVFSYFFSWWEFIKENKKV